MWEQEEGVMLLLLLVFHPRRKAPWKQKYFRGTFKFWEDSLCAKNNTSIVLMANYMLFTQVRQLKTHCWNQGLRFVFRLTEKSRMGWVVAVMGVTHTVEGDSLVRWDKPGSFRS